MLKVIDAMGESLIADAWTMYHETFAELNAFAVQRHLMYEHEFAEVMRDRRVQKYLVLDDGAIVGLSTYTNELDAVPLISPAYFELRWPDLYAEQRIWYCGFVAVHPRAQGAGPFREMVEAMCRVAVQQGGIISLDMCRFNDQKRHLSRVIPLMLRRVAGDVRTERLDEQSYWLYEFPTAGEATP